MTRANLRLIVPVAVALLVGVVLTILLTRGAGAGTPTPPESIQGPQVQIGDLIYNVTDMRILRVDRPTDAPYLVNKTAQPKGKAYLGVFLRIYNEDPKHARPSAPGFLLEPLTQPGLVAMQQASESPYTLDVGANVPAAGQLPEPGSAAGAGPIDGGLLLYTITGPMTNGQPFRLVVHTGTENGFITLPKVPKLTGGGH